MKNYEDGIDLMKTNEQTLHFYDGFMLLFVSSRLRYDSTKSMGRIKTNNQTNNRFKRNMTVVAAASAVASVAAAVE